MIFRNGLRQSAQRFSYLLWSVAQESAAICYVFASRPNRKYFNLFHISRDTVFINSNIGRGRKAVRHRYVTAVVNQSGWTDAPASTIYYCTISTSLSPVISLRPLRFYSIRFFVNDDSMNATKRMP